MNGIESQLIENTTLAYEMYISNKLTESELSNLVANKFISESYLNELHQTYLSEGIIKKVLTHPVTALATAGALGAGGLYLGTHPELLHKTGEYIQHGLTNTAKNLGADIKEPGAVDDFKSGLSKVGGHLSNARDKTKEFFSNLVGKGKDAADAINKK